MKRLSGELTGRIRTGLMTEIEVISPAVSVSPPVGAPIEIRCARAAAARERTKATTRMLNAEQSVSRINKTTGSVCL